MTRRFVSSSRFEPELFRWSSAAPVRLVDRMIVWAIVAFGLTGVAGFASFWFQERHVAHLAAFVALSIAVWYGIGRIVLAWIGYLALDRAEHRPAPPGLSVAVFTTAAPGEPIAMFEATLAALARVRYPHRTYLLDGTGDPRFRALAARHGAVWLDSSGVPGAKAGKINAALARTTEDFVLVLDPDHLPFPEFFDRVLGHFDDPRVGFVQVSQGYYNQADSPIARGAAEQTYGFYGPMQLGLHGLGCAVAIGANCTFRRAALASIRGHAVGLAEDLMTSVRLHAAGWRSVYVPEIVSRGLVPDDLGGYFGQQLKWATGAVDALFAEVVPRFSQLSARQRLSYVAIGTYYLTGPATLTYLVLPLAALWGDFWPMHADPAGFVAAGAPVVAAAVALHFYGQRWFCDRATEGGLHWRALLLKLAAFPIYTLGVVLAVVKRLVRYVPTPKRGLGGRLLPLAWPHLLVVASFLVTIGASLWLRTSAHGLAERWSDAEAYWAMVLFGALGAASMSGAIAWAARPPRRAPGVDPWERLPALDATTTTTATTPLGGSR
ncbi:glycosyltransferase family 2 protein [Sorangium sp. So ce861]|uniref:glycosyltransferase family 2 protein n=1 Tax=Sorangium sp. So ce861 TaxID=3133323 RepID=UPI003F62C9B6